MPNLLHRLKINEVSSVARGAGKGVKVVLMKADKVEKSASVALPVIFKRAIECGASIAAVAKAEVAMNEAIAAAESIQGESAQASALETSLSQCVDHLAGLVPAEQAGAFQAAVAAVTEESPMTEAEKAAALKKDEDLAKMIETLQKSNAALTRSVAVMSMSKEHQDYFGVMPFEGAELVKAQDLFIASAPEKREEAMKAFPPKKGKKPPANDDDEDDTKKMAKAIAESPVVKALQAQNDELRKASRIADFKKQAVEIGLPEAHGEIMMKAFEGDAEAIKKHNDMVKQVVTAAKNQGDTSVLFAEFGKQNAGGEGQGTTAYDAIKAKAEELRKQDTKLSVHQARNKVMSDPANAELVQRDKQERMKSIRTA